MSISVSAMKLSSPYFLANLSAFLTSITLVNSSYAKVAIPNSPKNSSAFAFATLKADAFSFTGTNLLRTFYPF